MNRANDLQCFMSFASKSPGLVYLLCGCDVDEYISRNGGEECSGQPMWMKHNSVHFIYNKFNITIIFIG